MPKDNLLKKIIESFEKNSELVLSDREAKQKARIMYALECKLDDVAITDQELYEKVSDKFGNDYSISFFQVCQDSNLVERLIANEINPTGNAHKTWIRYMVTEMAKKAYAKAKTKNDSYNMIYAATTIGKHHLTDKEDIVKPPFEDIIPFIPEITGDVSVLGIKPLGKKELKTLKAKLLKKYGVPELIEDASLIEDETKE